jgi:hypothetical protein
VKDEGGYVIIRRSVYQINYCGHHHIFASRNIKIRC